MRYFIVNLFLMLLLIMSGSVQGCGGGEDDPKCDSYQKGYRRIFTKYPHVNLGGLNPRDEIPPIDRAPFFIRLAHQSERLRRELIEGSVFGHTASEIQQKVEDQAAVNVATFAFEFFDDPGGGKLRNGSKSPKKIAIEKSKEDLGSLGD